MRVAVSGVTGLIGSGLRRALEARGDVVIPLRRPSSSVKGPAVGWDPLARTIDAAALEGVDAVVHLAGEPIVGGLWTKRRKHRIRESRVGGTRLIAEGVADLADRPRVMVSSSAIGFYGNRGGDLLSEESQPGVGFLAETCVEWEAATEPARRAGIRVVLARTGLVLSGQGGVLATMLPAFQCGLGAVLGSGQQYMSWITLEDEVEALLYAVDHDSISGPMNVVAPAPVSNRIFTRTLGRILRRPTIFSVPAFVLQTALGEMADELLLSGQRVLPARLREAGFQFRNPELEPALRTVLGR